MMKFKVFLSVLLFGLSLNVTASPEQKCNMGHQPDWSCICSTLCQMGEGGAACNCDRVP